MERTKAWTVTSLQFQEIGKLRNCRVSEWASLKTLTFNSVLHERKEMAAAIVKPSYFLPLKLPPHSSSPPPFSNPNFFSTRLRKFSFTPPLCSTTNQIPHDDEVTLSSFYLYELHIIIIMHYIMFKLTFG